MQRRPRLRGHDDLRGFAFRSVAGRPDAGEAGIGGDGAGRLSTKRAVVDDDLAQSALENRELLIIELRDEQFRDAAQVDRSGLGQARHAGVGQCDDDGACVTIGVRSPDESFIDQAGDTPGHA